MKLKWGIIWRYDKNELINVVKRNFSFAGILRDIGFRSWSSNHYNCLKKRLKEEEINFNHIVGGHLNNFNRKNNRIKLSKENALKQIFIENSTYHQKTIRNYVLHLCLIKFQCDCGNEGRWNNKKLSLQLDHINGIKKDNRLENLRFLCPNCHSQTDTFGCKNIK